MSAETRKRKTSNPPDGYLCNLCGVAGHWIQQCSAKSKSKRTKSNHVPVAGVDPSQEDIELARQYQKIKPPNCFCGQTSRLKKVKKSNVKENSRAVGNYFFFCGLKKTEQPCRFARPVDEQLKDKKERLCSFFAKSGSCKKGNKCMFSHELPANFERKFHPKENKDSKGRQHHKEDDNAEEQKKSPKTINTGSENSSNETSSNSSADSSSKSDGSDNKVVSQKKAVEDAGAAGSSDSSTSDSEDSSSSDDE